MKKTVLALFLLVFLPQLRLAAAGGAPAWYLEGIATLTAGNGRWVTDNARYRSAEEPTDEYVTEWKASFGGTSMTGRLFGVTAGEESVDYWEFREYWHPGRDEVVMEQFGWHGVVGIGTSWREGEETVSDQEFMSLDGKKWRTGHRARFNDENTHVTDSYDISDGEWTVRRSYTWMRAPLHESGPE